MLQGPPEIPGFDPRLGNLDAEEPFKLPLVTGVMTAIEYSDADDVVTRRRISFSRIDHRGGYIPAYCLERRAPRMFRLDRIVCFIDIDGVTFTPDEFFQLLGTTDGPNVVNEERPRPAIWDTYHHHIAILSAMSQADGLMRESEVQAIAEAVVMTAELDGLRVEDAECDALCARISRFKIGENDALDAARALKTRPREERERISRTLVRVMNADGEQHQSEFALMVAMRDMLNIG